MLRSTVNHVFVYVYPASSCKRTVQDGIISLLKLPTATTRMRLTGTSNMTFVESGVRAGCYPIGDGVRIGTVKLLVELVHALVNQ